MRKYVTVQGDMWDSIALSQLGDDKYADVLLHANDEYCDVYIFSAGTELVIPDFVTEKNPDDLPPWRRTT